MSGSQPPAVDTPRSIERMAKADFSLILDRTAKRNNTIGMAISSSIQNRMVMDDTDIEPSIVHWCIYHSINGNTKEVIRMMESIRFKYERTMEIKPKLMDRFVELAPTSLDKTTVAEIYEDSNMIHSALGITHERYLELVDITNSALQSTKTISAAMESLSKKCKHPNELAFCSMMIGHSTAIATPRYR